MYNVKNIGPKLQ